MVASVVSTSWAVEQAGATGQDVAISTRAAGSGVETDVAASSAADAVDSIGGELVQWADAGEVDCVESVDAPSANSARNLALTAVGSAGHALETTEGVSQIGARGACAT